MPDKIEREGLLPLKLSRAWISRVKRAIKAKEWNQTKLADAAGVSQASVSRFLAAETATVSTLSKIARALELEDPTEMLNDPLLHEWLWVGLRLRALDRRNFTELLQRLARRVEASDALEDLLETIDAETK